MKLNNAPVALASCSTEMVDGQMIIYNDATQKIFVANATAATIWLEISKASEKDYSLVTEQIADAICKKYNLDLNLLNEVCRDIEETIQLFIQESLIVLL
ncbi:MAG: PqqD family peptide modification chaperone [Oscillospiraceae bacterium]|nr:PqqD family peptide modification chaperone [Oscillospiraceae bacterium]